MHRTFALCLVALGVLWTAPAFARCDQPGDQAAVATIRDRVAQQCDCGSAFSRSSYRKCVRAVTTTAVDRNELPSRCKSTVLRCGRKSICGRPAAVTCRRTSASGRVRCSIKRDSTRCRAPRNGSACVVPVDSCCDALGCNSTSSTVPSTTTTSTSQAGTTTTTVPGTTDQLVVTTTVGTGNCGGAGLTPGPSAPFSGEIDSDATCTTKVRDLGLGCLYFGGGAANAVPPGLIPDGASTYLDVAGPTTLVASFGTSSKDCSRAAGPARHCVNNNAMPSCTSDAQCGGTAGACALDANCVFGPPLPIPSPPPVNALTTCVINAVQSDASGTFDRTTGESSVNLPLSTRVYITGNQASPCPKCLAGTCDPTWKTNTGGLGANSGQPCVATGALQTSADCRPALSGFQAPLGVNLSPLTTGTASLTRVDGLFCPGQTSPGAFGQPSARCIEETGTPAGDLSDAQPHATVLGATFCIPPTNNTSVDGVADLPGPGAIGLAGTARIVPASAPTTTTLGGSTTTSTTATTTTTTTLPLVCTEPAVSLPPFGELTIQIVPGTTNCGGAGLAPAPAAPTAGALLNGVGGSIVPLGSGCLYVGGGGNTALAPGRVPDGADVTFGVVGIQGTNVLLGPSAGTGQGDCSQAAGPGRHCIGGTNTGAACAADVECGGAPGSCALDANCIFGPPLPLPVTSIPSLTSCIVNVVQQNMCGQLDLGSGNATLNAALSSRVYLTGNTASPCPKCVSGTCNAGAASGQACTAVGALGTSPECPPSPGQFIAPLSVVLSPLTTGTLEKTDANGFFCPSQTNPGAFGVTDARTIRTQGTSLTGSTNLQMTAAGPFCVPATGFAAIDGLADVAGPGAVSVPSQADLGSILNLLGLPPLPIPLPPLFP